MNHIQQNYIAYLIERIGNTSGARRSGLQLKLELYCQKHEITVPDTGHQIRAIQDPEKVTPPMVKVEEQARAPGPEKAIRSAHGICEQCGTSFTSKAPNAKFCSNSCRVKNFRLNKSKE